MPRNKTRSLHKSKLKKKATTTSTRSKKRKAIPKIESIMKSTSSKKKAIIKKSENDKKRNINAKKFFTYALGTIVVGTLMYYTLSQHKNGVKNSEEKRVSLNSKTYNPPVKFIEKKEVKEESIFKTAKNEPIIKKLGPTAEFEKYQNLLKEAYAEKGKVVEGLNKIFDRQKEIIDKFETSGSALPQQTVKALVTEYFGYRDHLLKGFDEIDKIAEKYNKLIEETGYKSVTTMKFTARNTLELRYRSKNIFDIVYKIERGQDPDIKKIDKTLQACANKIETCLGGEGELNKIRKKYNGPFVAPEDYENAKKEINETLNELKNTLMVYKNTMLNQEAIFKEKYGLPYLFGVKHIEEKIGDFEEQAKIYSAITKKV